MHGNRTEGASFKVRQGETVPLLLVHEGPNQWPGSRPNLFGRGNFVLRTANDTPVNYTQANGLALLLIATVL